VKHMYLVYHKNLWYVVMFLQVLAPNSVSNIQSNDKSNIPQNPIDFIQKLQQLFDDDLLNMAHAQ
jgi:hypothetical protein